MADGLRGLCVFEITKHVCTCPKLISVTRVGCERRQAPRHAPHVSADSKTTHTAEGSAHRQWDGNGNGEGGMRAEPRDVCGEEICRSAPERHFCRGQMVAVRGKQVLQAN